MPSFSIQARYCTPAGNPGSSLFTEVHDDIDAARTHAHEHLSKQGHSKIDLDIVNLTAFNRFRSGGVKDLSA